MAIQFIEIDTNPLSSDIQTMIEQVTQVEHQTDRMFDAMAELDRMWDGAANAAFNQQFQIDNEYMKNLCTEVRHLIDCMKYAKEHYEQCEEEVYRSVAAIRLGGGA